MAPAPRESPATTTDAEPAPAVPPGAGEGRPNDSHFSFQDRSKVKRRQSGVSASGAAPRERIPSSFTVGSNAESGGRRDRTAHVGNRRPVEGVMGYLSHMMGTSYESDVRTVNEGDYGTPLVPTSWTTLLGDLPSTLAPGSPRTVGGLELAKGSSGATDESLPKRDEKVVATLTLPLSVSSAVMSRDASVVMTGCLDAYVRAYGLPPRAGPSAPHGTITSVVLASHTYAVTAMDLNRDYTRAISGGFDCKVMLWELLRPPPGAQANHSGSLPPSGPLDTVTSDSTSSQPTHSMTPTIVTAPSFAATNNGLSLMQHPHHPYEDEGEPHPTGGSPVVSLRTSQSSLNSHLAPAPNSIVRARLLKTLDGHQSATMHACFCVNDERFALTCGLDGYAVVWDLESRHDPVAMTHVNAWVLGGILWRAQTTEIVGEEDGMKGLRAAICVAKSPKVDVWDVSTRTVLQSLTLRGPVRALARAAGTGRLVLASEDKTVAVWNPVVASAPSCAAEASSSPEPAPAKAGEPLLAPSGLSLLHDHPLHAVTVSENGRWAVAGDDAGFVTVWDLDSDEPERFVMRTRLHTARIRSLSFSADATYVMTASRDKTVKVVDLRLPQRRSVLALLGCQPLFPRGDLKDHLLLKRIAEFVV